MEKKITELRNWVDTNPDVELYEFSQPVKSVKQAIEISGYPEDRIVKTILLTNQKSSEVVAAIVPATSKVDPDKLWEGSHTWKMSTPDEIMRQIGFPVGGVPPVLLGQIPKYVASEVLEKDFVIAGGGTTTSLIGLPPQHILDDGAIVKDITSD